MICISGHAASLWISSSPFRDDGWFNMTKAAKHFGKDLSNFFKSPDTIAYIDALQNSVESTEIVQTAVGRNGGTWAHPKLAVRFAKWRSFWPASFHPVRRHRHG